MGARHPGSSGFVNWPKVGVDGWHDTGEGGMWVYAFVPAVYSAVVTVPLTDTEDHEVQVDPFVHCHGPESTLALPMPDQLAGDFPGIYTPEQFERVHAYSSPRLDLEMANFGVDVLAAVCLGTTDKSLADAGGEPFVAQRTKLTTRGWRLVALLELLYEREVTLVTYLDS
ncbi:MAG: hypothetical protein ABWY93_18605 [Mycobacterium sp.]